MDQSLTIEQPETSSPLFASVAISAVFPTLNCTHEQKMNGAGTQKGTSECDQAAVKSSTQPIQMFQR